MSDYTREDLDQDTVFARGRWEAQTGKDGSFDRWLAEVQSAAWAEGAHAVSVETRKDPKAPKSAMYGVQVRTFIPANPYRQEGKSNE